MTLSAIKNARISKNSNDYPKNSQQAMPSSALPNWQTATQFSNPMSRPSLASMVADLDVTVTIVDNSEDEEDSSQLCAAPEVGKRRN